MAGDTFNVQDSGTGAAICGRNTSGVSGAGVYGRAQQGAGVRARSSSGNGLFASSYNTAGVRSRSTWGVGVKAESVHNAGIYSVGWSASVVGGGDVGYGGYFTGYGGFRVDATGAAEPGYGIYVTSDSAEAGSFSATNDDGIRA